MPKKRGLALSDERDKLYASVLKKSRRYGLTMGDIICAALKEWDDNHPDDVVLISKEEYDRLKKLEKE